MTYDVFGGTLSLTQSINQWATCWFCTFQYYIIFTKFLVTEQRRMYSLQYYLKTATKNFKIIAFRC